MKINQHRLVVVSIFCVFLGGCMTSELWRPRLMCDSKKTIAVNETGSALALETKYGQPILPKSFEDAGLNGLSGEAIANAKIRYKLTINKTITLEANGDQSVNYDSYGEMRKRITPVKGIVLKEAKGIKNDGYVLPSNELIIMEGISSWRGTETFAILDGDKNSKWRYSVWCPDKGDNDLKSKYRDIINLYDDFGYKTISIKSLLDAFGTDRWVYKGVVRLNNDEYDEKYISVDAREVLLKIAMYRSSFGGNRFASALNDSSKSADGIMVDLDFTEYSQKKYYENDNTLGSVPLKIVATPFCVIGDTLVVVSLPIWYWFVPHWGAGSH